MKGSLSGVRFGDFYDAAPFTVKGGRKSPSRGRAGSAGATCVTHLATHKAPCSLVSPIPQHAKTTVTRGSP
jgi:hypothetical protein